MFKCVSSTINFHTNGPICPWQKSSGAVWWFQNQYQDFPGQPFCVTVSKCSFLKEGCVPLEKWLESVVISFITGASHFFIHVYIHYLHLSALESKPACSNMLFKMVHVELCISKVSVRFQTYVHTPVHTKCWVWECVWRKYKYKIWLQNALKAFTLSYQHALVLYSWCHC